MTAHERLIKDECGYTGRMPYVFLTSTFPNCPPPSPSRGWLTRYFSKRYWDETADIGALAESELWSDAYFGGDGAGADRCVATGPFANLTLRWLQDSTVSEHCLTRRFQERALEAASTANIAKCDAISTYEDAWQCFSNGPHGSGHGGVGGIVRLPSLLLCCLRIYNVPITREQSS